MSDSPPDIRPRVDARLLDELLAEAGWLRSSARQLARGDAALADDLEQGTWMAALEHPPERRNGLRAWLHSVLENVARQLRRSESRRHARERRVAGERTATTTPSTAEVSARLERSRTVVDAVEALPEPYRTTMVMRWLDERTPSEIAARTDTPLATVKSRLRRARALLRDRLGCCRGLVLLGLPIRLPTFGRSTGQGIGPTDTGLPVRGVPARLTATSVMLTSHLKLLLGGLAALSLALLVWLATTVAQGTGVPNGDGAAPHLTTTTVRAQESATPIEPAATSLRELAAPPTSTPTPPPAATRLVHVVDLAGRSLADHAVTWTGDSSEPTPAHTATTDADGLVPIPLPARGQITVRSARDDRITVCEAVLTDDSVDAGPATVVVCGIGGLHGTVRDARDGRTLANVAVDFRLPQHFDAHLGLPLDDTQRWSARVSTGPDGTFVVERAPATAALRVDVVEPGYHPLVTKTDVAADGDTALDLALERPIARPGFLAGRVVDPDSVPVEGAVVVGGRGSTRTDANGMFALPLAELHGRHQIVAMARGFSPARHELPAADELERPEHLVVDPIELRLGRELHTIGGRVFDHTGTPVEGAQVFVDDPTVLIVDDRISTFEAYASGGSTMAEYRASAPPSDDPDETAQRYTDARNALWNPVTTDALGRFTVEGLEARDYSLAVLLPDSLLRHVSPPFTAGRSEVEIRLPADLRPIRIAGVVVDRDGEPLAGVELTTTSWPLKVPYEDARMRVSTGRFLTGPTTLTDREGRFALDDVSPELGLVFDRADLLPQRLGDGRVRASTEPLDALRIEMSRRVRLRVECAQPDRADSFRVEGADGETIRLQVLHGQIRGWISSADVVDGRSQACVVDERVRSVVLLRDGQVVERRPVVLDPAEFNVIQF